MIHNVLTVCETAFDSTDKDPGTQYQINIVLD